MIDRIAALKLRWVNPLLSRHSGRDKDFAVQIHNKFRPFLALKLSQGSIVKTSDSHFYMPDERKRDEGPVKY